MKEKIRVLHEQLETCLDILNPAFELEDYKSSLEKLYGFCQPVEARLNALETYESLALDPAVRCNDVRIITGV